MHRVTPENSGASQTACNIINRILQTDGMKSIPTEDGYPEYLARVTDEEIALGKALEGTRRSLAETKLRRLKEEKPGSKTNLYADGTLWYALTESDKDVLTKNGTQLKEE